MIRPVIALALAGLFLAGWAALYWHGPYNGSAGHSSGDLVFYTTNVQLLSTYGLPLKQLGLEGEAAGGGAYFVNLELIYCQCIREYCQLIAMAVS